MRIGGLHLGWFRRRWWLVVGSVAAVVAISMVIQPSQSDQRTAEAVLIVRSGATPNTPGNANEANRLAVTYSQLIPQDSLVLDRASRTLGVGRADLQRHVSVVNDPDTSILRVRYSSPDAETAVNGARALADALAGPQPASVNFNGLAISRLPDSASSGPGPSSGLPTAVILGLCLGAVLVIAWERADGRIDDIGDLEDEVRAPITELDGLSTGSIVALLERWKALANGAPADVALVAAAGGYRSLTAEVAAVFAASVPESIGDHQSVHTSLKGMTLHSTGAPETWEVGEAIAHQADLAVLVIAQGTAIRDVRKSLRALEKFGVRPVWVLLGSDSLLRRARRRHGPGEPISVDVGTDTYAPPPQALEAEDIDKAQADGANPVLPSS